MLAQHLVNDGPVLAARVEWAIPHFIHEVPDYLIGELPVYRKELQQALETEYERIAILSTRIWAISLTS